MNKMFKDSVWVLVMWICNGMVTSLNVDMLNNMKVSYCQEDSCNGRGVCYDTKDHKAACDCFSQYYHGSTCRLATLNCYLGRCYSRSTSNCINYYGNYYCECISDEQFQRAFYGRNCQYLTENLQRRVMNAETPALIMNLQPIIYENEIVYMIWNEQRDTSIIHVFLEGFQFIHNITEIGTTESCRDEIYKNIRTLTHKEGESIAHTHCIKMLFQSRTIGFHLMTMDLFTYSGHKDSYHFEYFTNDASKICQPTAQILGGGCSATSETIGLTTYNKDIYLEYVIYPSCTEQDKLIEKSITYDYYTKDSYSKEDFPKSGDIKIRFEKTTSSEEYNIQFIVKITFEEISKNETIGKSGKGIQYCWVQQISTTLLTFASLPSYGVSIHYKDKIPLKVLALAPDFSMQKGPKTATGELRYFWKFDLFRARNVETPFLKPMQIAYWNKTNLDSVTTNVNYTTKLYTSPMVKCRIRVHVERNITWGPDAIKKTTVSQEVTLILQVYRSFFYPVLFIECQHNCGEGHPNQFFRGNYYDVTIFSITCKQRCDFYKDYRSAVTIWLVDVDDMYIEKSQLVAPSNRHLVKQLDTVAVNKDLLCMRSKITPNDHPDYALLVSNVQKAIWSTMIIQRFFYPTVEKTKTGHVKRLHNKCSLVLESKNMYHNHPSILLQPTILCFDQFNYKENYPLTIWFWQRVSEFPNHKYGMLLGYSSSQILTVLLPESFGASTITYLAQNNLFNDALIISSETKLIMASKLPYRGRASTDHFGLIFDLIYLPRDPFSNSLMFDLHNHFWYAFIQKLHFLLVEIYNMEMTSNPDVQLFIHNTMIAAMEDIVYTLGREVYGEDMNPYEAVMLASVYFELVQAFPLPLSAKECYLLGVTGRTIAGLVLKNARKFEQFTNHLTKAILEDFFGMMYFISLPSRINYDIRDDWRIKEMTRQTRWELQIGEDEMVSESVPDYQLLTGNITAVIQLFHTGIFHTHVAMQFYLYAIASTTLPMTKYLHLEKSTKLVDSQDPLEIDISFGQAHYYIQMTMYNKLHDHHNSGAVSWFWKKATILKEAMGKSKYRGVMILHYLYQPYWYLEFQGQQPAAYFIKFFDLIIASSENKTTGNSTTGDNTTNQTRSKRGASYEEISLDQDYEFAYRKLAHNVTYDTTSISLQFETKVAFRRDSEKWTNLEYFIVLLDRTTMGAGTLALIVDPGVMKEDDVLSVYTSNVEPLFDQCAKGALITPKNSIQLALNFELRSETDKLYVCLASVGPRQLLYRIAAVKVRCLQYSDRVKNIYGVNGDYVGGCSPKYVYVQSDVNYVQCDCTAEASVLSAFSFQPIEMIWNGILVLDINFQMPEHDSIWVSVITWALLTLYTLAFMVAVYLDNRDDRKPSLNYIITNDIFDRFYYVIITHTAIDFGAGTTSHVGLQIYGTRHNSRRHVLYEVGQKGTFRPNRVDWFVMTSEHYLGGIRAVDIWIDHRGPQPAWRLERLIVRDYEFLEEWIFRAHTWFSLIARPRDPKLRHVLFLTPVGRKSRRSLQFEDWWFYHLWLGAFSQEYCHAFNRTVQVTTVFSIVFVGGLIALLSLHLPEFKGDVDYGEVHIDEAISIGLYSLILSIMFNYPLYYIMKNTNPNAIKPYYQSKLTNVFTSKALPMLPLSRDVRVIGWVFFTMYILMSIVFLEFSSTQMGIHKATMWIISLLTIIVVDFLFVETLHFYVRTWLSRLFHRKRKKDCLYYELIKVDKDAVARGASYENQRFYLKQDMLYPVRTRIRRVLSNKEKKFQNYKELMLYMPLFLLFLILLNIFMGYERNLLTYSTTAIADAMFVKNVFVHFPNYHESLTLPQWYQYYLNTSLLFTTQFTAGSFMVMTNWKLYGVMRLRQHRIRPELDFCPIDESFKLESQLECHSWPSDVQGWDTRRYDLNWKYFNDSEPHPSRKSGYFQHRPGIDTNTWHRTIGHLTVPEGGYIVPLARSQFNSRLILQYLVEHNWIDAFTRIIVVEFNAFNVHVQQLVSVKMYLFSTLSGDLTRHVAINPINMPSVTSDYPLVRYVVVMLLIVTSVVCTLVTIYRLQTAMFSRTIDSLMIFMQMALIDCTILFIVFFTLAEILGHYSSEQMYSGQRAEFTNFERFLLFQWWFFLIVILMHVSLYGQIVGVVAFFQPVKIFVHTLRYAFSPALSLFGLMLVIVYAFTFAFYLEPGVKHREYHQFERRFMEIFMLPFRRLVNAPMVTHGYGVIMTILFLMVDGFFILSFMAVVLFAYQRAKSHIGVDYSRRFTFIQFAQERIFGMPIVDDARRWYRPTERHPSSVGPNARTYDSDST